MLMLDTTLPQQDPQTKLRALQELTNHQLASLHV
jgi:hypothetical protein